MGIFNLDIPVRHQITALCKDQQYEKTADKSHNRVHEFR